MKDISSSSIVVLYAQQGTYPRQPIYSQANSENANEDEKVNVPEGILHDLHGGEERRVVSS